MLGHLDPEFLSLLDETCERLRTAFATRNALTLPVSGTGSAGMEACFVNLVEPGDTVIVGVNGVFGERMCDVASRCGATVERVDEEWGRALDPQRLLDAQRRLPHARLVAVVHAETSTGVHNDVAPLARCARPTPCSSSTRSRRWAVCPSRSTGGASTPATPGPEKCLGVPPGLSPVTFSDRADGPDAGAVDARPVVVPRPGPDRRGYVGRHPQVPPHCADLHGLRARTPASASSSRRAWRTRGPATARRRPPPERLVRHGFRAVRRGRPAAPAAHHRRSCPPEVDEAGTRKALLATYGIEVGGGLGQLRRQGLAHRPHGPQRPRAVGRRPPRRPP